MFRRNAPLFLIFIPYVDKKRPPTARFSAARSTDIGELIPLVVPENRIQNVQSYKNME